MKPARRKTRPIIRPTTNSQIHPFQRNNLVKQLQSNKIPTDQSPTLNPSINNRSYPLQLC